MFHSVSIYTAHSLEEQGSLRALLEENNIEHSVSAKDTRATKGFYPVLSPELLMTQTVDFIFYVAKKDAAVATALLEREWKWEEESFDED